MLIVILAHVAVITLIRIPDFSLPGIVFAPVFAIEAFVTLKLVELIIEISAGR